MLHSRQAKYTCTYQIHKIGAMLLYTVVFYCYAFVWLLKGNHLQSEQAYYWISFGGIKLKLQSCVSLRWNTFLWLSLF